jgi:hypothetical protein
MRDCVLFNSTLSIYYSGFFSLNVVGEIAYAVR